MNRLLLITALLLFIGGIGFIAFSMKEMSLHKNAEKEALALAKNAVLEDKSVSRDPVLVKYDFEIGEVIGILNIPKLKKELPIIEGAHTDQLNKGVGHYPTTKLPEQSDQIFLAGHRDSVFRDVGKLENGDTLSFVMKTGTYFYKIINTYIVNENDLSVIRSTSPEEILTLSTCYPFNVIGPSPERYIIEAKRIHKKTPSL
jgi:sortase A